VVPFLIYAAIALVAFSFVGGGSSVPGLAVGVLLGGALYIAIAVVMVKFGWNPPTFGRPSSQAPSPRAAEKAAKAAPPAGPKPKPSATSRTNAGNRRAPKRR
jgi:hypothetical protein